jgi:hypothetical protein
MSLEFLEKEYLPSGATTPQYDAVYKSILTYQAKNDQTARCYLGSPTDGDTSRFESHVIEDPMEDMPFDIAINSVKRQASLSFTKSELASFAAPESIPNGPGISAVMALADDRCGVQSASGIFKMKRVWTKLNSDGEFVELFEGFLSFNVTHSSLYRRKGHGSGSKVKFAFWGVRARTDGAGKEIGLRPMAPVSVTFGDFPEEPDVGDNPMDDAVSHVKVNTLCPSRISCVYCLLQRSSPTMPRNYLHPQNFWATSTFT